MGLRIHTDCPGQTVRRALATHTAELGEHLRRMASGLRVEHAADDAASLARGERQRAHLRSLAQGQRNANDAVDLLATAADMLASAAELTGRLQELALAARNGTLGSTERTLVAHEFDALVAEINRIGDGAHHGDRRLFDGSTLQFQIGAGVGAEHTLTLQLGTLHAGFDFATTMAAMPGAGGGRGLAAIDPGAVGGDAMANAATDPVRALGDSIAAARSALGAQQSRLHHALPLLAGMLQTGADALSRLVDADLAATTAAAARERILVDAGVALLAQANTAPAIALRLLG